MKTTAILMSMLISGIWMTQATAQTEYRPPDSEGLEKMRALCRTLQTNHPDAAAQQRCRRFLELTEYIAWRDSKGMVVRARYLGHGMHSSGSILVALEDINGEKTLVPIDKLDEACKLRVNELSKLLAGLFSDAKVLRDRLGARVSAEASKPKVNLNVNAGMVSGPYGSGTWLSVGPSAGYAYPNYGVYPNYGYPYYGGYPALSPYPTTYVGPPVFYDHWGRPHHHGHHGRRPIIIHHHGSSSGSSSSSSASGSRTYGMRRGPFPN